MTLVAVIWTENYKEYKVPQKETSVVKDSLSAEEETIKHIDGK